MADKWPCVACGNVGFDDGSTDGFFYCLTCGAQAEDIVDTGVAEDDFFNNLSSQQRVRATPTPAVPIKAEPVAYYDRHRTPNPIDGDSKDDGETAVDPTGPTEPSDFNLSSGGGDDDDGGDSRGSDSFSQFSSSVRMRYTMGLQLMIEMQCEVLVEKFKVSPLICGVVGPIWLRFLESTGVFEESWAERVVHESETRCQVSASLQQSQTRYDEPYNAFGKRGVMIWFRSLRKKIPLSCSLAVCFLACHVMREAVLPTDVARWSADATLPYLAAFTDVKSSIGRASDKCPIGAGVMFRPLRNVSPQRLESLAASIAAAVGLDLPPVNFYGIVRRYAHQLCLPHERIVPDACKIHDWVVPPELWLSSNARRIPSRVYVLSVLIVAVRLAYDINGYGFWEASLSGAHLSDKHVESAKVLNDLKDTFAAVDHQAGDLDAYLEYCKDVVFAGMEPDYEEKKLADMFWDHYKRNASREEDGGMKPRGEAYESGRERKRWRGGDDDDGGGDVVEESVREMKVDMEENMFTYVPPRVNVKRVDYLHYNRKRDKGSLVYVSHADYYILVRACAAVAQVDARLMHTAVLSVERRLAWTDKWFNRCLLSIGRSRTRGGGGDDGDDDTNG